MNRVFVLLTAFLLVTSELFASPGGQIAREFFDTTLGKIVGVLLIVVFLPLVIRRFIRRKKSVSSTKAKLDILSRVENEVFDQINLRNRVNDVFIRVHRAWSDQNLDSCDGYMTGWYIQNQQSVFLDEWKKKGLKNICSIEKVKRIHPIHIRVTDQPNFENSRIMYAIDAHMEDYMINVSDTTIIEGKRGLRDVETIWTFKLEDGVWKVDNIEPSEMLSEYMRMKSDMSDAVIDRLAADLSISR